MLPFTGKAQAGLPEENPVAYQRLQASLRQKKEIRMHRIQSVTQIITTYTIVGKDTLLADSCWKVSGYDRNGNLLSETCHPLHFYDPYKIAYEYDAEGRPMRMRQDGKVRKEYFYDSCGRVTLLIDSWPDEPETRQVVLSYSPDMGRLCRLAVYDLRYRSYMDSLHHDRLVSKRLVESYCYAYKDDGRILKYQQFPKRTDSLLLEYVPTDTGVVLYDRTSTCGRCYCYAKNGNLVSYSGCDNDHGPPWGNCRFTYDERGLLITSRCGGTVTNYWYDRYGKTVREMSTEAENEKNIEYKNRYDANGNLLRSVAAWPGGVTITVNSYTFYINE